MTQVDTLVAQLRAQRASATNEPVICIYDTLIAALLELQTNTGTGTVTSVGLALDTGLYTVSGSPVILAGTLTGALNTQAANLIFAGPASGAAAKPTFRAAVAADINGLSPSFNGVDLTSGSWLTWGGGVTNSLQGDSGAGTLIYNAGTSHEWRIAGAAILDGVAGGVSLPTGKTLTPAAVAGIVGTTTNDNVQAGSVGEYISGEVLAGAAVSLTNNTAATIVSIALAAGDYDCYAMAINLPNGSTTQTSFIAGISLNAAANPATAAGFQGALFYNALPGTGLTLAGSLAGFRATLAAPATLYLRTISNFAVSTMGAYGYLAARRRR